jgi:hypothetical protein
LLTVHVLRCRAGKLYRFRALHLWAADEQADYFSADVKYLSFDSLSGVAASEDESPLVSHILARDEFSRELWAAIGIAKVLDRVLVLPRFNCFCDRYWYPILPQCRLPGSQPFKSTQACPLDQIIDVGAFMGKDFIVDTRVDGFLEHPSAAQLVASKKIFDTPFSGCLTPSQAKESLAASESVLHVSGGVKGLFCGFPSGSRDASALDRDVSRLFKGDWCCHQNGSMPFAAHAPVEASEAGALDAGPAADVDTIRRAKEVWALTAPERDKWQARIFGVRFEEGTAMSEHNHYAC